MLDRLPAHIIDSILLLSTPEDEDEGDTRSLAHHALLCRRMRDPVQRAALFRILPDARVVALLKAEPALARHVRGIMFVPPEEEEVDRATWHKAAAQVLVRARWARRLVVIACFDEIEPFVIAALAALPWTDVYIQLMHRMNGADEIIGTMTDVERLDVFLELVEATASQAVRLAVDLEDLPIAGEWGAAAAWPSLPTLRTLSVYDADPETLATVSQLGPAITELQFNRQGRDAATTSCAFSKIDFAALAATLTLQRIIVYDGGHYSPSMRALPQLQHLDFDTDDANLYAINLFSFGRPLQSLTLRAAGKDRTLTTICLIDMALRLTPRAPPFPPWRVLRVVGKFGHVGRRAARKLEATCRERGIKLDTLLALK